MTKGGGGVSQKMTKDDGGRGGARNSSKLADIICEQPLTDDDKYTDKMFVIVHDQSDKQSDKWEEDF